MWALHDAEPIFYCGMGLINKYKKQFNKNDFCSHHSF